MPCSILAALRFASRCVAFSLLALGLSAAHAQEGASIVTGVDTLWGGGTPGPILSFSDTVVPLVAANATTASPASLVLISDRVESGRIVASGHDGFATNESLALHDNLTLFTNAIDWLDAQDRNTVLITTGHREWTGHNSTLLHDRLNQAGYDVTLQGAVLSEAVLQNAGAVLVGNAWGDFTTGELDALDTYVRNGGGVFMLGLGWSWSPYNPGTTLADYPMNRLGQRFGVQWVDGSISDPTHNHNGSPLFTRLYPETAHMTLAGARNVLETALREQSTTFASALQTRPELRASVADALRLLKQSVAQPTTPDVEREKIYAFYLGLLRSYPGLLRKGFAYAPETESAAAWIRELLHKSLMDVVALDPSKTAEVATEIGVTGRQLELWTDHTILLQDNGMLSASQVDVIGAYLRHVPASLHHLRSITVADYFGDNVANIRLNGVQGSVNVFGFEVGQHRENAFPDDSEAGFADVFSIVVAHEINHVVHAHYIGGDAARLEYHDALNATAGSEPMHYLRSQFTPGFFIDAPQEFFASISNQWFTDSRKTLALGVSRFESGIPHPMDQALLIADVYSLGSDSTRLYRTDTDGLLTKTVVPLGRDAQGRIVSLTVSDEITYVFDRDSGGSITGIRETQTPVAQETEAAAHELLVRTRPNPFRDATTITFDMAAPGHVQLIVYDVQGREVERLIDGPVPEGQTVQTWNTRGVAAGAYVCRLVTSSGTQTQTLILQR